MYSSKYDSQVSLPSPHHQLKVDKDLASLHQNTATLTGLNIGAGQVCQNFEKTWQATIFELTFLIFCF